MPSIKKIFLLIAFVLILPPSALSEKEPTFVSLIQLIANPEKYNHQLVSVTGFLQLEFETGRMYLSEEDYRHRIAANSVCVEPNSAMDKEAKKLNRQYVTVVGIFSTSHCGTDSFRMGRVAHLTKFSLWPPVSDSQ